MFLNQRHTFNIIGTCFLLCVIDSSVSFQFNRRALFLVVKNLVKSPCNRLQIRTVDSNEICVCVLRMFHYNLCLFFHSSSRLTYLASKKHILFYHHQFFRFFFVLCVFFYRKWNLLFLSLFSSLIDNNKLQVNISISYYL